ncbi:MAG: hypothetical protein N2111_11560 [Candidatus Sumerlaeaceae bacterium]|nr:hypothetical protein [Candidatus Sumerlaeaceae bacterium]
MLDGEAEVITGGRFPAVAADGMIIMPAGISHAVSAGGLFKMTLILAK